MATNAEAYEVSTYETDGPSFHFVEPISPVDPFDIAPRTRPTTPTRQTQGTDFFEAVYLDSPFGANGTTRPLRVRKKSAANARIAGIGPSSTLFVFVTIYDKLMHRQVHGAAPSYQCLTHRDHPVHRPPLAPARAVPTPL